MTRPTAGNLEAPHTARATARLATHDDVSRLAAVLAEAFVADPPFVWMMPNEARRLARLRRFFAIELRAVGLHSGVVWTTPVLSGASISCPPGAWRLPPSMMLRHGWSYTRAFGAMLPKAVVLLTRMEARHPRQPHHYIPFVGVAPASQGIGIGTQLLDPILARSDAEQLPAYLEATTERNAALYARLGFQQIGELGYGGSEPLRMMLRPPGEPADRNR